MSESDQDKQRKALVFRVLDDLKAGGERINADKVARLARMGKQTVLPFYREWRYTEDLNREEQEELPDDLVGVIKRGIAKWKHDLAQQTQAEMEQTNTEIDELKLTIQNLSDDQSLKAEEISELSNDLTDQKENLARQTSLNHEKDQYIARLQAQLDAAQQTIETLDKQLAQQKEDSEKALLQIEAKLDQRHQEQLNHWIKVVDSERRQKQELEKSLAQHQEQQTRIEREKNELNHRLDSKNRAFMEACEERNRLRAESKTLQHQVKPIEQSCLLLDCHAEALLPRLRHLVSVEQQSSALELQQEQMKQSLDRLQSELQSARKQKESSNTLEKQLEKSRGYIEALEKNLERLEQKTSKS